MKINPQYTKILLNDIPYLIPYGQAVADFSKALMLNEMPTFYGHVYAVAPKKTNC